MTDSRLYKTPQHVAIIMDGNGRWARRQSLSRLEGHKRGSEVAREIVTAASRIGISYLTLYAFSSENWRRDPHEVSGLMALLKHYLETEAEELHKEGVRLKIIGERGLLPNTILNLVEHVEDLTKSNKKLILQMAVSYGSRAEMINAVQEIAKKARDRRIDPDKITEQIFEQHLYTAGVPDPDLLLRTSGEQRISNYLLWQVAYTELVFVDKFWPDFTPEDFMEAILTYQNRERRFGTAA
ncbi:MAG: isoprenyl transferase [Alphaproteobacteria bacterium]|jgi:undecaprenyl diphosphate synthase|nr:isoprenyl transferase [Alphaproteobacteria bacterium]MBP9776629.1 isoprenyl transferase [Alphaproteobacteria bacterium]